MEDKWNMFPTEGRARRMPAELAGIITSTALMCRHRLLDITWKTCRILLRTNQDVNLNCAARGGGFQPVSAERGEPELALAQPPSAPVEPVYVPPAPAAPEMDEAAAYPANTGPVCAVWPLPKRQGS